MSNYALSNTIMSTSKMEIYFFFKSEIKNEQKPVDNLVNKNRIAIADTLVRQ